MSIPFGVGAAGQASSASLIFIEIAPGVYIPSVGPGSGEGQDVKDSDTEAVEAGYIAITPITNDRTAGGSFNSLESVITQLD